jgi:hypothetical protein
MTLQRVAKMYLKRTLFTTLLLMIALPVWVTAKPFSSFDTKITTFGHLDKPFALDEKGLRQVDMILRKRIKEVSDTFRVYYEVNFQNRDSYETTALEQILQEPNKEPRKIVELKIIGQAYREDPAPAIAMIHVQFSARSEYRGAIDFAIYGSDKDWITLTKQDLSDCIDDRGGSACLDRFCQLISGAWRMADYAAVCRVVRLSEYTWSGVWPASA